MYIMMLCIIYYNTCIFGTVLYTIMCMISINNDKDIPSTINTHNTELQMVKVHINNTLTTLNISQ